MGECFGAFGRSVDDAAKSEFFQWFSLEETERRRSGSARMLRFAPSGAAFRDRVAVAVTADDDGTLIALELAVARAFVEGVDDAFAADIVASFLRTAAGSADASLAAVAARLFLPRARDPRAGGAERVYAGEERRFVQRFAACTVTMENVPSPSGDTLAVRVDRAADTVSASNDTISDEREPRRGGIAVWLRIAFALVPIALLLHSFGWLGGESGGGVQFWIDKDREAIVALSAIDPLWVAKAYVATVAPRPPMRACLDETAPLCITQRIMDRAAAEQQARDSGYWVRHVPGLLFGVPVTTITVLRDVYRRGRIAGTVAVLAVLLAGWGIAALVVRNGWLSACLAPFVGSALAWLLVALFALPVLRGVLAMLQFAATLAAAGSGVFTLLDRGQLMSEVWEGPVKRMLPSAHGVRAAHPEAASAEAVST